MSTTIGDLNRVDAMPNHIDTPTRMLRSTGRNTTHRPGLLSQDRERLNEDLRSEGDVENMPTSSRTFGLGSRNAILSSGFSVQNKRLVEESNFAEDRRNVPTLARTFGFGSRNMIANTSLSVQNHHELRGSNVPPLSRTFGLKSRNGTLDGRFLEESLTSNKDLHATNARRNYERVNISTVSRTFGLESQNGNVSFDVSVQNNRDHLRNLNESRSMLMTSRPFGLQSRNSSHLGLHFEDNLNLNRNLNNATYKTNNQINMSSMPRAFSSTARNTTLSTGLHIQDGVRYNEESFDNEGFRKPPMSRVIRGRASTMSSRLFSHHNVDRYNKDLSNINGLNVTHISRRGMDTLSESRLPLNVRHNWMDNHSVSGSVLSTVSLKAQFINLLENLHHSILNIGPHMTAEAVRMEFDKAKEGLENISEMSFAPTVREGDAASIVSHSSKYNCPQMPDRTAVLNQESFNLRTGKEILENLIGNSRSRSKGGDEEDGRCQLELQAEDHDSALVFAKPKPYFKRKSSKTLKIKTPQVSRSLTSKLTGKGISLKQWYPIAVGPDLALCGVDEQGTVVKTDPVKKRVSSRKVELVSGLVCTLVGSPSATVLSPKIMNLLKNGLTERWRMLRKELLTCQTVQKEVKKRPLKSPAKTKSGRGAEKEARRTPSKSPVKVRGGRSVDKQATRRASKSPAKGKSGRSAEKEERKTHSKSPRKPKSGPKEAKEDPPRNTEKVSAVHTRSGRAVKPPSPFWIGSVSGEVSSSQMSTPRKAPGKKGKRDAGGPPEKKTSKRTAASPKKSKTGVLSTPVKKGKAASPRKLKASQEATSARRSRLAKVTSRKLNPVEMEAIEEAEEVVEVHSSTEDSKRREKARKSPAKRKREVAAAADADATQRKRSKLEQKTEAEMSSLVTEGSTVQTKGKQKKTKVAVRTRSPKPMLKMSQKSQRSAGFATKTKTVSVHSESRTETKGINEFEENFELGLDDIEIPEIANVSGHPQLSRSQLRLTTMETPPLKYFNSNLRIMRNETPSPDWCLSQRTESEVKQFQKRREEAFRRKIKRVEVKKTVTEKAGNPPQNKDLRRVLDWVAEKTVKIPQWNSKVLQYVISDRRQLEQGDDDDDDDDEEEEDVEAEFL